jgi:transcriptional regulator with XRE-family HTH domain
MKRHIKKHIKPLRLKQLPADMREELKQARLRRGWSQRELGRQLGLPQMHISGIESGKIAPRYDTLLDYVRGLDYDLLLVPRSLVPAVLALVREHKSSNEPTEEAEERSLYARNEDQQETRGKHSNEL